MFNIILRAFIEAWEEIKEKEAIEEEQEIKKEELSFSTNIEDVQDFCFREGIAGNCTENCPFYMKENCELLEQ